MTAKSRGRPKADADRDLRAALLRASRQLLDEGGTAALSLREVARRTGCTHQAPYHYFADRETILAELVTVGFQELASRLSAANGLAATQGPRAALLGSGHAYIDFALSQPGLFRIMFRPDLCNPMRFPRVRDAGRLAFGELERLIHLTLGPAATPAQASILWAHVHGLACLLIDGPLGMTFATEAERQQHLDAVGEKFVAMVLGASDGT